MLGQTIMQYRHIKRKHDLVISKYVYSANKSLTMLVFDLEAFYFILGRVLMVVGPISIAAAQ
jgi:hypothetical protein